LIAIIGIQPWQYPLSATGGFAPIAAAEVAGFRVWRESHNGKNGVIVDLLECPEKSSAEERQALVESLAQSPSDRTHLGRMTLAQLRQIRADRGR